jgi:hypothetical protein
LNAHFADEVLPKPLRGRSVERLGAHALARAVLTAARARESLFSGRLARKIARTLGGSFFEDQQRLGRADPGDVLYPLATNTLQAAATS